MMAQYSLHAYDADVFVDGFLGIQQARTEVNGDVRCAAEAENMETPNGVLQPGAASAVMDGEFTDRVETLASFTRRWYEGSGKNEWYVCCAGGKLYYRQAGDGNSWVPIQLPSGISAYSKSVWSCVNYEITPELGENTVDVLLMSNDTDGMIMVVPPDKPTTYGDLSEYTHNQMAAFTHEELSSPAWLITTVDTQGYKFGVIERSFDRIWGADVQGNPDMLVYSAPYDPLDWEQNVETPEDGAGNILQPSWDGDKFCALKQFGEQLLAFKRNRIWRVLGTNPGVYEFHEQYGGGTALFNTVAVDKERVLMESANGLSVYDGMSTSDYMREAVQKIWDQLNRDAMDQTCAALFRNRYYVAFPMGSSAVNNAMLVYNFSDGTILYYPDMYVESFMVTEERLFYASSTLPGKILEMKYDSWKTGEASGKATKWISPWIDFGYKRIQKGGFDLYFLPEVQETPVTLKFSIQTEKKTKTKYYTVAPLDAGQQSAKQHKGKRLHFGGNGRRFRIIIETEAGVTAPWRLIGGLQLVVETDPD